MGILKNFISRFSKPTEGKKDIFVPLSSFSSYGFPIADYSSQELLYKYRIGWAYTCVNKIAEEASQIEINLYQKAKNGDIEKVEQHDALDLLDRVNPFMTFYDLKFTTYAFLETAGKAYWWLVKNDNGSQITEIYPWLNPATMSIIPDPVKFISGYQYQVPGVGTTIDFAPEDIIYFRYFDPADPYGSISPLKAANLALETDLAASNWNFNFFKNQAIPAGILEFDRPLTETQAEMAKANWEKSHRGEANEHRIAVIGGGKYNPVGVSPKEMDFATLRQAARDEILAIFRVPKSMLGIVEDVNRANAEAMKQVFLQNVIMPKVIKFVGYLNEYLLPNFGDESYFFDYENPVESDKVIDLQTYQNGLTLGWLSPNEVRTEQGLEPYEGGDVISIPFGATPAGVTNDGVSGGMFERGHTAPAIKKRKPNIKPKSRTAHDIVVNRLKELSPANKQKKEILQKEVSTKEPYVRDKKQIHWEQKIALTNVQEAPIVKALGRLFAQQEKQVVGSIKNKSVKGNKAISFNFNVNAETKKTEDLMRPYITGIVMDWGRTGMNIIGLDPNSFEIDKYVIEWINSKGLDFAKQITLVTKDKIKRQIVLGMEAGNSMDEIATNISENVFEGAEQVRAKVIARTEVTNASNYAQEEAWKQSGVVIEKEWTTAYDERVCDSCGPMDGKTVKLGEEFNTDEGPVEGPALHPNCRCDLVPVTKDYKALKEIKEKKKIDEVLDNILEELK